MNILEHYYEKIIKYDLINKFSYTNLRELPKLKKIVVNFGCKSFDIKHLASALLALELITTKRGSLTKSKRANILLKIRKGHPVGCALILKKSDMYQFFFKLLSEVFPNSKDFKGIHSNYKKSDKTSFSFTLKELIAFEELGSHFYLFNKLPSLNITLITNTKTQKELFYLLNSFKLPLISKSNCNSIGRV
jgi:large subunit ribosomal protein L5